FIRINGKRGLVINIYRQPSANVVSVSEGINHELDVIRKTLPIGLVIEPGYNEAGLVLESMANVRDAIIIGVLLIVGVLFFFLRNWRATVIAAVTIPLCALAAFGVLWLMHQSLNLMSLGGLAVAIGLVIDDAIVVLENVDRQMHNGLDPQSAVAVAMHEL